MNPTRTILDYVLDHEAQRPTSIYLTQPYGGGRVTDYSWAQTLDQARRMAAHLKSRRLPPGARIAILSKNCAHFIIAELAIWMAGGTTVAIFPTETAETIRYVLGHSEASLLFVGKLDNWAQQQEGVPQGMPRIAFPLAPPTPFDTWDGITSQTAPLPDRPTRAADDLAMLIYTSGSTGQPKGVMVTFGAITAAGVGIVSDLRQRIGKDTRNRVLSYLPLAHSYERSWVEAASLVDGLTHLYFSESLDTFLRDLQRARPTVFLSVPRLWLKFQQGVFTKMPPAKLDRLLKIPVLRRIVARKVLAGLGLDAVKQAGSGSAPIPAELIGWYRRLGLKLFEGYGMTEDNSYSHSSNEHHGEPGYVGVPLPGVEVRLSDDGEVLIKSPAQCSGYYKQPELSAESFTDDGYFRTGDLGERRPDGLLKITGRVKELFKTSKGKYIAPAKLENLLNNHPMVELSMISGAGQPQPFALIVLAEDVRAHLTDPALRERVQTEMQTLLRDTNAVLAEYEHLQMIVIAPEPWTIENGMLTPTMKIKRGRIEKATQAQVDAWYASGQRVLWS